MASRLELELELELDQDKARGARDKLRARVAKEPTSSRGRSWYEELAELYFYLCALFARALLDANSFTWPKLSLIIAQASNTNVLNSKKFH